MARADIHTNNTHLHPSTNMTPSSVFSPRDTSMMSSPGPSLSSRPDGEVLSPSWTVETARRELRHAINVLSHRGLKLSAKWASEQLIGLPGGTVSTGAVSSSAGEEQQNNSSLMFDLSMTTSNNNENNNNNNFCTTAVEGGEGEAVEDIALYAKSLLDLGEYAHAAAILSLPNKDVTMITPPLPNLSKFGVYIRAYSLYMAGERRKEEELVELREPLERTTLRNAYLSQLCDELQDAYYAQRLDAFGLHVYGMVLKDAQQCRLNTTDHQAHTILMESILQFPWNWSAWLDLSELCLDDPSLHEIIEDKLQPVASHYMYHFFCAHVFGENQAHENSIAVMERLMYTTADDDQQQQTGGLQQEDTGITGGLFQSPYLASRMAVAHYQLREFEIAQECFVALQERDPYRLEDLDVYSNILYVQENRVALSQLAHGAVRVDKYRPETCCIVGNYYSLKSQRAKAVQYFQRALKLDRNYLSAWTLMGHEYVEMKNTAAAMEAYRRAVDVNERDYRAWYGLGQTYEFLNMQLYALSYYRKAAALRPYDPRMWCAIAGCYLELDRRPYAIRCYERAVSHNDSEGIATQKLAFLYRQDGDKEKAARCYLRHLELRHIATTPNRPTGTASITLESIINGVVVNAPEAEALLYLASYHKDHGEYETAAMCCSRLLEYPGPEKEEGKALLREIRSRRERSAPTSTPDLTRQRRHNTRFGQQQQQQPLLHGEQQELEDDSMDERKDESSFEFSP